MSSLARSLAAVVAVAGALMLPGGSAQAQPAPDVEVSVGYFHEHLSPYGRWVWVAPYGSVWVPSGVGPEWRPYTLGSWVYTDVGWTWVSDEPWGWGPYHYGRWAYEPAYGWLWVPGVVWGPAWVAWRWGGGYIGWAPLAPVAGYEVDWIGGPHTVVSFGWSFCHERAILERPGRRVFVPRERVTYVIERTRDVTAYSHDGRRVVSRPIDPDSIARVTGRTVPVHHIVDAHEAGNARVDGTSVRVFRPVAAPTTVVQRAFAPVGVQRRESMPDRRMPSAVGRGGAPGHTRSYEPVPRSAAVPPSAQPPRVAPAPATPRAAAAPGTPRVAPAPASPGVSRQPAPRAAPPREESRRGESRRDHRAQPQASEVPAQPVQRPPAQPAGIGRSAPPQVRMPAQRPAPAPRAAPAPRPTRDERRESGGRHSR